MIRRPHAVRLMIDEVGLNVRSSRQEEKQKTSDFVRGCCLSVTVRKNISSPSEACPTKTATVEG